MGTISKNKSTRRGFVSIRVKYLLSYISLIAVVIIFINTYPLVLSRDVVQRSKESTIKTGVVQIGSYIEALDHITSSSVGQVMALLDTSQYTYVMVLNSNYEMLYYQGSTLQDYDESIALRLAERSITGCVDMFDSYYSSGAFRSYAAAPIVSGDTIIAVVCVYEYDSASGAMITSLKNNMLKLSAGLCVLAVAMSVVYSGTFTRRITKILKAIANVREGEYTYRINVKGRDELSQLAEEFNDLTTRLQDTEQKRRRFVADASHELKTPLASIRLLSDSIIESPDIDMDTVREFVTDIRDESERLSRITTQLLSLTRLDNNRMTVRKPIDCRETCEKVVRSLQPIAISNGIELHCDLEEKCFIMASSDDLFEVVFNLGENAIKYNIKGGRVDIRLYREKDSVLITVDDTGIGIPAQDMPYIFDRFYRVDEARDREEGGSGLGLSIVKSTVERHGGMVKCKKNESGGMKFIVNFPVCVTSGKGV